jgi:hypothetical protein
MEQPTADIDFRFEGTSYHLAALSPRGQQWLDAEGLGSIVKTIGINKVRRKAIAAGLRTLISGHDYKPGYALQERPTDPDLIRIAMRLIPIEEGEATADWRRRT